MEYTRITIIKVVRLASWPDWYVPAPNFVHALDTGLYQKVTAITCLFLAYIYSRNWKYSNVSISRS